MKSKFISHGFLRFTFSLLLISLRLMIPIASAQPDTVDLHLKVSLFEETKVHIIWFDNNNYPAVKYFVEKSIDNNHWDVLDSITLDSLVDIMHTSEPENIDLYGRVLFSTESGIPGYIKNVVLPDTLQLPTLCYRIRGILANSTAIITEYRMIYGVGLINQPPPYSPLAPGDCQVGSTVGWTQFVPYTTQTVYKTCCIETQTKYFKTQLTGYLPPPASAGGCDLAPTQPNCTLPLGDPSNGQPPGSDCTHNFQYDPCCGHKGSCYALCNCGQVTPGTATWLPCNPVYTTVIGWITTSVTPLYSPMEITGMDVSCINGTETYCVSGGISGWVWTVPTGQGIIIGPSNQSCVTVQWLTAGVHNLSVSAEVCSGITESANLDVTVLSPGSLSYTISTSNVICEGTTVCFSPVTSGTQTTSYEWFINGQSVALEFCPGIGSCGGQCGQYQQIFIGSPNGTQYTIDLVIYDINGNPILCNGASQTITVYSNPVSTFQTPSGCLDINSLVDLCADQLPGSGVSYSWVATGATPSAGNSQCINNLSWPSAGGYDVTLTVSNPGCTSSTTNSITIKDPEVCCNENSYWQYTVFNAASATETWSDNLNPLNNATSPIFIKDLLHIPSGANITINNMEFQFGLGAKVVIEAGAILTLNGTTFKGSTTCSTMWQGVFIYGIKNDPNLSSQGQFYMNTSGNNKSKIENAELAIFNMEPFNNSTIGGYFQLNNAEINDCRNGVFCVNKNDFGGYQNIINNCSFTNPNPLWYPNQTFRTYKHVHADNNTEAQLLFSGHNTFRDAEMGIFLLDATGYHISNCEFHNVGTGIWFIRNAATLSSKLDINNNTFDIFGIGIRVDNGTNDNIGSNIFNTRFLANASDPLGSQFKNFSGIEMNASSGFSITDNTFYNLRNGIKVKDSGPIGGKINTLTGFGNQFYSCWRGIQTYRDNSNLDIKCNYFQNNQNQYSFSTAWYVSGILKSQGSFSQFNPSSKDPAGNEFFRFPQTRIDLYAVNATAGFNYTHHDYNTCNQCRPTVNNTNYIVRNNAQVSKDAQSCTGFRFMESVNNNPTVAQQVIATETDEKTRRQYINELVNWYVANNMENEAKLYLESINDLTTREILMRLYMKSASYTEVQDLINERSNLTDEESINYVALHSILLYWAQNGQSPYDMTDPQANIIRSVAESQTRSAIQAQSIIAIVFDTAFVSAPSDTVEERYGIMDQLATKDDVLNFQLVPNPSNGQLYLSFNLPETDRAAEIVISDILGIELVRKKYYISQDRTLIELTHLKTGSYLIYLKLLDSGELVHRKISIIK